MKDLSQWKWCFVGIATLSGICVLAQTIIPKLVAAPPSGVVITWNTLSNASNYHIQWSTNSLVFPRNQFVYVGKTNRAILENLPTARIYARIKADGASGATSPWSEIITFNNPFQQVITFSLRYRPYLTNSTLILWTKSVTNSAKESEFYDLIYEKKYQ